MKKISIILILLLLLLIGVTILRNYNTSKSSTNNDIFNNDLVVELSENERINFV